VDATYEDPETWRIKTPQQAGSWWPEWTAWLDARSGTPVAPPANGEPGGRICSAMRCAGHLRIAVMTGTAPAAADEDRMR
jgi:polyhydroxyalkanoate synthase